MKIDKKTMVQLVVLFALLIGAAYYFLYYAPANERIAALGADKAVKEDELMQKQMKVAVETDLDNRILEASDYIEKIGGVIFVDVKPEDALRIAGKLNKGGRIVFDSVNTSQISDAEAQSFEIQQQLSFTADYYDVMEYMRSVRKFDKRIAISSGSFSLLEYDDLEAGAEGAAADADSAAAGDTAGESAESESEGTSSADGGGTEGGENGGTEGESSEGGTEGEDGSEAEGTEKGLSASREKSYKLVVNLVLNYRSLPMLEQFGNRDEQLIKDIKSKRELAKGPFSKYADYIAALQLEKERQSAANTTEAITFTFNNVENDGSADGGYESYNPRSVVNGFDDNAFFFVASDPDTKGSVTRSLIRKNGSHSANLLFDFITAKESNVVSVVFEKEQRLDVQPANIYMQVYAFESSNHSIGMVLLDSAGREFKVTLAEAVDWVEWNEISAPLPEGITYPCVVQRIFVEGVGYGQKTTGRYIFDQLEVDYPQPNFEY